MSENEETTQSSTFKDMKTGLMVFGILQIIFGGFCALMVPFAIFGMIASIFIESSNTTAPMRPTMMIPGVLIYVAAAVWFIWMGIGSIKARRWARALLLVTSWLWLVGGISGLIFMALFMPHMFEKMEENGQMPAGMVLVVKCVVIGFMAVFLVIIPAVLVLFYGNKNVKATCEFRDTKVRWTDKYSACSCFELYVWILGRLDLVYGALWMGCSILWIHPKRGKRCGGSACCYVAIRLYRLGHVQIEY